MFDNMESGVHIVVGNLGRFILGVSDVNVCSKNNVGIKSRRKIPKGCWEEFGQKGRLRMSKIGFEHLTHLRNHGNSCCRCFAWTELEFTILFVRIF